MFLSKQHKLTNLLGLYWDLEGEVVRGWESQFLGEGLWFKIPLTSLDLTKASLDLKELFFIIHFNQKLRGNLSKPYLAVDESYQIDLCINQYKKLSQVLNLSWDLRINESPKIILNGDNLRFWKEAFKQKYLLLNIKRISKGTILDQALQKEELLTEAIGYANNLKENILRQLNFLKNPKLKLHRLELWNYTKAPSDLNSIINQLPPMDFGVKDLINLQKVMTDFSLNISNTQLISETDPELEIYRGQLEKFYKIINSQGLIQINKHKY